MRPKVLAQLTHQAIPTFDAGDVHDVAEIRGANQHRGELVPALAYPRPGAGRCRL
ncbi:MAG: hypothetical protein U5K43_08290 [Halofilum sp. (in: g-proteobacteria)]|nr:hypothetical protein [Halofilum sp. (in: g-proteobacteria)]